MLESLRKLSFADTKTAKTKCAKFHAILPNLIFQDVQNLLYRFFFHSFKAESLFTIHNNLFSNFYR